MSDRNVSRRRLKDRLLQQFVGDPAEGDYVDPAKIKIPERPSVRTVESLGEIYYKTKPAMSNIVAGFIIGLLMIVGGLAWGRVMANGFSESPDLGDKIACVLGTLLGVSIAGAGGYLIWRMKGLLQFQVVICSGGFYVISGSDLPNVFAWDEVVRVDEAIVHEKLPIVKGVAKMLIPSKTSRSYTVTRCDGISFFFDENVIPRTSLLAGPLSGAHRTHEIIWIVTEEKQ